MESQEAGPEGATVADRTEFNALEAIFDRELADFEATNGAIHAIVSTSSKALTLSTSATLAFDAALGAIRASAIPFTPARSNGQPSVQSVGVRNSTVAASNSINEAITAIRYCSAAVAGAVAQDLPELARAARLRTLAEADGRRYSRTGERA